MAREKRSRIPDLGRPEVTELEFGRTTHRVAAVEPMDVDGVRTMTVGTIGWGIVAVALLPFWGNLQDQGRTWWLWTAIAGLGLGLMGIEFCKRRRDALHDRPAEVVPPVAAPTVAAPTFQQPTPPVAQRPAESRPVAPTETPDRPAGGRRRRT
ncbi:hypothetical protein AFL01nite_10020 [Aeromicrobium flavum]|uniref:DUF2530 domain-containing protein n=1 Tax=Aeromicrobium flavum TaxID=416568 RepID=A0A512HTD6_9ACTN|nr:DUF2530 domain-containing protein [Aeromicrobium flavum]GEO88675.1 hypothetical protein AFL01nite_10020 [Aeromicrobium flavum]